MVESHGTEVENSDGMRLIAGRVTLYGATESTLA